MNNCSFCTATMTTYLTFKCTVDRCACHKNLCEFFHQLNFSMAGNDKRNKLHNSNQRMLYSSNTIWPMPNYHLLSMFNFPSFNWIDCLCCSQSVAPTFLLHTHSIGSGLYFLACSFILENCSVSLSNIFTVYFQIIKVNNKVGIQHMKKIIENKCSLESKSFI